MLQGKRYLMFISYVGTGFRGSQLQSLEGNVETVQYVIEKALKDVYQLEGERPIRVFTCSRTDTGVHAIRAPFHGVLPQFNGKFLEPQVLQFKLNKYLSNSKPVRVQDVYCFNNVVKISSALLHKTYLYRVGLLKKEFYNEKLKVQPIMEIDRTHLLGMNLDFDLKKAEEAATLFEGRKDFGAILGRPSHNINPTVCHIKSFKVEETQPLVPFDPLTKRYNFYNFICKGDKFLFRMVRRMVTLTLSVGYNILTLKDIEKLFSNPVPSSWPRRTIKVVSGGGLYLVESVYDIEKLKLQSDMNAELVEQKELVVESA